MPRISSAVIFGAENFECHDFRVPRIWSAVIFDAENFECRDFRMPKISSAGNFECRDFGVPYNLGCYKCGMPGSMDVKD